MSDETVLDLAEKIITQVQEKPKRKRGDGRIYQRGGIFHFAYYLHGKEVRESSHSTDSRVAEKLLKDRLGAKTAEQYGGEKAIGPKERRVKLGEILENHERHYRQNGGKSLCTFQGHMKPLVAFFQYRKAAGITVKQVDLYKDSRLKDGVTPATINRELAILRSAYTQAVEDRLISLSLVPKIRPFKGADHPRQGFFLPAEVDAVISCLPARLKNLTRFAFGSAWRLGDITGLKWSAVDRKSGVIRLEGQYTKTGKPRTLPLVGELGRIIEEQWEKRTFQARDGSTGISNYVFHSDTGGKIAYFHHTWRRACKNAGLPGRCFHDLRRSAIKAMMEAGSSQAGAMSISGHRSTSTFLRYQIIDEAEQIRTLARTQDYVRANPGESRGAIPLHPKAEAANE